ncbi:hypothetical protein DICPUDRAFT_92240 [Dictyostelium purpureum]|uniref:Uncharacterized protein n=1 Tax=Dictyostelium purpureum TaxID=5786 RepID=F0ZNX9_DICPU|nr:uncharacterized protein DICPUDRAFT_92240 [Dictyostelium purpureum]EGC34329.1 hypothetical protein DICPUDRAFT_92240 [Dictyostelium purpureum]|eukprot:XP_003289122.1 hypothetical protein DICPUDRAFT_92240 [Dictyostelium purpureum]
MKRLTFFLILIVSIIYISNFIVLGDIPPQPDQPLPNNDEDEMVAPSKGKSNKSIQEEDDMANLEESGNSNSDDRDGPLQSYRTEDIYFNIIWKCQSKEIFSNDVGYYDLASVNSKKNCHTYNTPCDEIVSLNITDCPGSKPFNSSCKYILNYFKDTMYCDNTPVLVTDFSCDNFGKHHDIGAIDVVCKKFEQPTERPEASSSVKLLGQLLNFNSFIIIIFYTLALFLFF